MVAPFQLLSPRYPETQPRSLHLRDGWGHRVQSTQRRWGKKKKGGGGIKEDGAEWKQPIALCSDETYSLWCQMCLAILSERERKQQKEKNPTVTSSAEEAILQTVAKATGLALTSGTLQHPTTQPPPPLIPTPPTFETSSKQLAPLGLPATYTSF